MKKPSLCFMIQLKDIMPYAGNEGPDQTAFEQFDLGLCCSLTESVVTIEYIDSEGPDQFTCTVLYSRTSLSRTRFFRITAYLEVKIWSLF